MRVGIARPYIEHPTARQIPISVFLILPRGGENGNLFRASRKIVLDKRTNAWFNDCNPILHQTKDAEVKLSAHPQRVSHS